MEINEIIQLITLLLILGSLSIAVWIQHRRERFDSSDVYLNKCLELVVKAKNILFSNGELTESRIDWVTAARIITRVKRLSKNISTMHHKEIYDAEHDFNRHEFYDLIKNLKRPLTISHFLGCKTERAAFKNAVFEGDRRAAENWVPGPIVSEVFRYFAYPADYEDPLDVAANLSDEEIRKMWLTGHKAVAGYVAFRKRCVRIGNDVLCQNQETGVYEKVDPETVQRILNEHR